MSGAASDPTARTLLWRSRAWITLILFVPTTVATVFSAPAFNLPGSVEACCVILGWLLFCAGAAFRWWAALYIGGRKDNQVVCQGPYSVVRHPLYLGTFLMTMSIAAFLQSLTMFVAVLLAALVYLGITLAREERRMIEIHGDAYRDYIKRVPSLWPNWANYYSPPVLEVRLTGMAAELRRTVRWMWIPILSLLLLRLRTEEWWPRWVSMW